MGSKSKSSTSTNTTVNDYTTTLTDNSITEIDLGDGAFNAGDIGGNVTITHSDSGAIEAGKELSLAALDFGGDALEGGYNLAETAILSQQEISADSIQEANNSTRVIAQQFSDGLSQVLSFAQTANTSEDGQISKDLIKWGALALVAVFLFMNLPSLAKVVK